MRGVLLFMTGGAELASPDAITAVAGRRMRRLFPSPKGRRRHDAPGEGGGPVGMAGSRLADVSYPLTLASTPHSIRNRRLSGGRAIIGKIAASILSAAILLAAAIDPATASGPDAGPKRVVTLGGDVTEIVYALGEGKRLVGRDATSSWPEEAAGLPNVGYFRQLGAEGVLSLKPDLILATAQAGPAETLKQIGGTGVKIVTMPDGYSPDGLVRKIETIANALGQPEKGARLAAELKQQTDAAQALITGMPGRPKVLFIIAAGGGAPLAAGTQTAADAMVKLAGGENVFGAHTGYKAVSLEATAAAGPEAIVMMAQTLENLGGVTGVTEHPALRLTPAAKSGRVIARDGIYMLGFGPRLPQAMVEVARAIRGEEKK